MVSCSWSTIQQPQPVVQQPRPMVYQSHIQQQGYTTPCYQQPGSSANLVTPACYPLGIPNQAGTLAPGNLFNTSAGFIPQSMASISDAIQAQQFISQATQPLVMCTQSFAQIQQTRVHHAQVSVPQPMVFQPQYQANSSHRYRFHSQWFNIHNSQ